VREQEHYGQLRGLVTLCLDAYDHFCVGQIWDTLIQERDVQHLVTIPKILRALERLMRNGEVVCYVDGKNVMRYRLTRRDKENPRELPRM
jgi:hypothetical protein